MSTALPTPAARLHRPGRRTLVDLGLRALIALAAGVAVVTGATAWVRTPLSAAAAVAVLLAVVARTRRNDPLHGPLAAVGGGTAALIVTGIVLHLLPTGITTASWGAAVALLELAVLAGCTAVPVRRAARLPRIPVAHLLWGAAVAAVLAGAVAWSVASFDATHVHPVALSAERSGDTLRVTVDSGATAGPYELDLVSATGRSVVARDLRVGPGASRTVVAQLPAGTRGLLQLVPSGSATPLRELIVDTEAGR